MKKPMTTEELFNKIHEILKEKNKLPDILDYGLSTNRPVPITNYEFDLKSNLSYGGNEGKSGTLEVIAERIEFCGKRGSIYGQNSRQ